MSAYLMPMKLYETPIEVGLIERDTTCVGVLRNNNNIYDGDVPPCPHVPAGMFFCNTQMHAWSLSSFHSIQFSLVPSKEKDCACMRSTHELSLTKKTDREGKEHFGASVWKQGSSCIYMLSLILSIVFERNKGWRER
jgi:hypothetical protein